MLDLVLRPALPSAAVASRWACCVWIAAALALAGCEGRTRAHAITSQTSVLLVVIDTLRADHLDAWGYHLETAPRIARLAEEGVQFTRTFANSSWTRPSMASMLTGRYPRETGIFEEYDPLADEMLTLAERFAARGYLTLGLTGNTNTNRSFGFAQGFEVYRDSRGTWERVEMPEGPPKRIAMESAAQLNARTLRLLDQYETQLASTPFFLQILYVDPHPPFRAHPDHQMAGAFPGYDTAIRFVDDQLGVLLDQMEDRALLDDTLVIVTSDHGEGLQSQAGLPLSKSHGDTLYDSVLHVPLVFWHPALEARQVDGLTELIDITPTLIDLLGWPSESLPGRALFSTEEGRSGTAAVISETSWREIEKLSLRTDEYRYVRNFDVQRWEEDGSHKGTRFPPERRRAFEITGPEELYRRDGASPENPRRNNRRRANQEQTRELRARLDEWRGRVAPRPPDRPDRDAISADGTAMPDRAPVELSDAERDQLRAMGYLDGADRSDRRDGESGKFKSGSRLVR